MAGRSDAFIAVGAAASAARVIRKDFSARIISRVGSTALRRGMHSGNRGWFYVAAAATGLRLLHKYTGRTEDILSIKLRPGESFEIREIPRRK
ncbi:MAG TPA: hypothetical protein VIA11_11880 [Acidimicrobiia bacterium]|jgi:hypothetical protein|nr:hypothetical protein [Acidimicrobiia bacterium]